MIPLAFTLGALAGTAVTATSVHIDDWWAQRLVGRWRRCNLPAGGVVLTIIAAVVGSPEWVYAVAAGLAVSAVAWRWVEPLPPMG